jgi:glycerol-3-phosphate dehydrogenase (NAD(P)+)
LSRVAVLGAGSWGTALAIHLAKAGTSVRLWARSRAAAEGLSRTRENSDYLPGHRLPEGLEVTHDLARAVDGAVLVLFVAPAQASRNVFLETAPHLEETADLVIASKGLEEAGQARLSQVLSEILGAGGPSPRVTVLSGPSFAAEVARGDPTAVVVAGTDPAATLRVQRVLSSGSLRAYRNSDLVGVELAGALKNVIAVATGVAEGIGFGSNTRAALITRGMAEIARLGTALGGRAETFAGLAGAGDLILTCTGSLSRNRSVGIEVGRGRPLAEVLGGIRMVAEGVPTTRAAVALSDRLGVDMPIAHKVHEVLFGGLPARDAVQDLLSRRLKDET